MRENIYIFYGGESVEHDISIITALQVMRVMPELVPVYIGRNGVMYMAENLKDVKIYSDFDRLARGVKDVTFVSGKPYLAVKKGRKYAKFLPVNFALLCTHGRFGEDGALQGILESCHIPYSSSNHISSALCMDKIFMKDVLSSRGVPTVKGYPLVYEDYLSNKERVLKEVVKEIKFPLILKPARLGSSIGIVVCKTKSDLVEGIEFCAKFDNRILVERFVEDAGEYNTACVYMNGEVLISDPVKVANKSQIFTFEEKYLKNNAKNDEKIEKNLKKQLKTLAIQVYKIFNCFGVVRVDFIYDRKNQKLLVNELNSIPGSLAFYLFKDLSFKDLLNCLIEEGKERSARERFVTAYDSEALDVFEKLDLDMTKK